MLKYGAFAQVEGGMWPPWSAAGEGTLVSPPTIMNMKTYKTYSNEKNMKKNMEGCRFSRGGKTEDSAADGDCG